jgi:hypothetical protein
MSIFKYLPSRFNYIFIGYLSLILTNGKSLPLSLLIGFGLGASYTICCIFGAYLIDCFSAKSLSRQERNDG